MPALGPSPLSSSRAETFLTPAEEKSRIKEQSDAAEGDLKEGAAFYVVSARWWKQWERYVNQEIGFVKRLVEPLSQAAESKGMIAPPRRPPPIDNSELLAELGELKEGLQEEKDYILHNASVWNTLHSWYGGGPEIKRFVITTGLQKYPSVEVFRLVVRLKLATSDSQEVKIAISKRSPVSTLLQEACDLFKLNNDGNVRLQDCFEDSKAKILSDLDEALEDAWVSQGQLIKVQQCIGGNWPDEAAASSNGHEVIGKELMVVPTNHASEPVSIAGGPVSSKGSSFWSPMSFGAPQDSRESEGGWFSSGSSSGYKSTSLGLTGLTNLGNTCFMNSALQCLVHTPPLVDYFTSDYSAEINKNNPLGMDGELAVAFGELLRKLWSPGRGPIAPRAFKTKLAKFAPQFSGYNQHDSQELLAFLLDGLHEDLNRVHKKPYIELKDADGQPDDVVANEFWAYHKARNDSVIVDTCQGQYKSTLVCPKCQKVSVTFDPFMYLSLPLPSKATRTMHVTLWATDGHAAPVVLMISIPKAGKIRDLEAAVKKAANLDASEHLVIADVYNCSVYRIFDIPGESITTATDTDKLFAFKLPGDHAASVLQRRQEEHSISGLYHWKPYAAPLAIPLPSEGVSMGYQLYDLVEAALRPFAKEKGSVISGLPLVRSQGSGHSQISSQANTNGERTTEADKEEASRDESSAMEEDKPQLRAGSSGGGAGPAEAEESMDSELQMRLSQAPNAQQGVVNSNENAVGECDVEMNDSPGDCHTGKADCELSDWPSYEAGSVCKSYPFKLSFIPSKSEPAEFIQPGQHVPAAFNNKYFSLKWRQLVLDWEPGVLGRLYDMSPVESLPEVNKGGLVSNLQKRTRQEAISLYQCVEAFLKEEPLGPEDMWYCPQCKEHRQASKKLDLWRLPEILVVHLKRFSYSRYLKNKLDTMVNFPIHDLDLSPYVASGGDAADNQYELYSVSNHYGGMGGGHYTAYAKLPGENRWYNFDDSQVSATVQGDVLTSAAYVLFYRRKRRISEHGRVAAARGPARQVQLREQIVQSSITLPSVREASKGEDSNALTTEEIAESDGQTQEPIHDESAPLLEMAIDGDKLGANIASNTPTSGIQNSLLDSLE